MRLFLDARDPGGGIGRRVRWLRRTLGDRLGPEERIFYGAGSLRAGDEHPPPERSLLRATLGGIKRVVVDQLLLPRLVERSRADLFHSPNYLVPHRLSVPAVVDCYDLTLLDRFETKKRGLMKHYERRVLVSALERARFVITPSHAVREGISRRFDLSPGRVETIYPALQDWPPAAAERLLPRIARGPFFLTVGTLEPRKNLERLLAAHGEAWRATRIPLVLVGPYGWRQRHILRRVARSEDRVHWLGWVGDDVLRALYDRAAASVQVSLAEGFDLPVLEGMAAGCPLVLSELAVHREVAGACALYAPATDVAQLAARLREAAAWGERPRRERAEEGRSRAAELATLSGIDRYLAVYRRALRA